jgi:CheY-like chemotaxis protein
MHMGDSTIKFGETAKGLAKNPLGIIALFIVLVYGFASLVTAFGSSLTAQERLPLIYFLVLFPVLVLAVFAWLVSRHAGKLYSPSDYKNEDNYVAVVASLAAAAARRPDGNAAQADVDVRRIAEVVRDVSPRGRSETQAWQRRILWVDDRPQNNVLERQAFEALGLTFTLALSTQQALDILKREQFAAIISDMGRKEGPREGYVLLDALRASGNKTPFFIYAGSNLPEHKREAGQHGGQGSTNHPQELFEMVTGAVLKGRGNICRVA